MEWVGATQKKEVTDEVTTQEAENEFSLFKAISQDLELRHRSIESADEDQKKAFLHFFNWFYDDVQTKVNARVQRLGVLGKELNKVVSCIGLEFSDQFIDLITI